MRTRLFLRLILVVIPTAGLMLLWLLVLPRQGQAAPATDLCGLDNPTPTPTPYVRGNPAPTSAPTPDPRWVELVRAQASGGNAPGGGAPAVQALTVNLNLTDLLAAGRVPSAAQVDITVTCQGKVIEYTFVQPVFDGSGFFYVVNLPYYDDTYVLYPGYVVWVSQGGTTISITIPTLTSLAYPQTDILSGTAPANAALTGYLFPHANPGEVVTQTATASADGSYQLAWAPGVDLRPRDSGYLLYTQDAQRMVSLRFVAPFLRVQVNGNRIEGFAAPRQTVSILVEDDLGTPLIDVDDYSFQLGYFNRLSCSGYHETLYCVTLLPSYRVIVSAGGQTFSTTVVTVTAHADQQAGLVSGQAPPSQPVDVLRFRGPLEDWYNPVWDQTPLDQVVVTATAQGNYVAALPLVAGNYGAALVTTPDGNQEYARYAVPYLYARLGAPPELGLPPEFGYQGVRMWGQVEELNAPITVEIQGPSGYLKDWYTLASDNTGYFYDTYAYDMNHSLFLESGDRITITTSQGPQVALLLPVLTAAADLDTDIVSGQAPPLSQVVVTLDGKTQLTVTADAQGQYSADFSSLGGHDSYASGGVVWTSPEGDNVERPFYDALASNCPASLSSAQIGGNDVYINGRYDCGPLTLRLRGANGQLRYEHDYDFTPDYDPLTDENGHPILIAIGDKLEIVSAGQTEISIVPKLTVSLDPHTDRVQGQAPPFAGIELTWESQPFTTTANAQGNYSLDLAGVADLQAGSTVQAALGDIPRFYTVGVLPVLNAYLYGTKVTGILTPFTPYSITLITPVTTTAPYLGTADSKGNIFSSFYPPPLGGPFAQPGDRMEMRTPSRFFQMILPLLTARLDVASGVVSGQAPPDTRLLVTLFRGVYGLSDYTTVVTATTSGTYTAALPIPADATYVSGSITHFTSEDTRTTLGFNTPYWKVFLGSSGVNGSAPMDGAPITITLRSADGTFSQVVTDTGYRPNNYFQVDFTRSIRPGDRLSLETSGGLVSEFTVPNLTAAYDFTRRVLEGRAPPDGEVVADLPTLPYLVFRHVRVGPDGHYGVDVSDLNIPVGEWGRIEFTDRFGNTVTCSFVNRGYPLFLPVLRWAVPFP